jgi:RNA polymerase sigma factor (sigma-70 family)
VPLGSPGEDLLRLLAPQVLAALSRRFSDFAAAEDAVQEALFAASIQWENEGVPDRPRGWLIQVAARRLTDQWRAEEARQRRQAVLLRESPEVVPPSSEERAEEDDSLLLLFMCCHPALTRPSAIALTLRAVGGLTTAEIARAFLVPEATMAQRIVRAKLSIKASAMPFAMPPATERQERLSAVLHVLYLIFNEGYASTSGDELRRHDLASEAIRLAREVHRREPEVPEVAGLLALLLLTDARRRARSSPEGALVPLDRHDRSLWDRPLIEEGTAILHGALSRGAVGPYQVQAAIAALHDEATKATDTDWPQILALYGLLAAMTVNPMVKLNQAVAAAMVHGAGEGLSRLALLAEDPRLAGHYRLDAVRGHLFEMAGDLVAAVQHYLSAANRTASVPERDYLMLRAARLRAASPSEG